VGKGTGLGGLMKLGEIRWHKFKAPDKRRPVLILTRDSILEYLGKVTVAPITSTVRNIPSEVLLSKYDGILKNCAINFDHIQTVSKGKVGSLISTLSPQKMEQVRQAILFALSL
jgi:mRNA interferase MazF